MKTLLLTVAVVIALAAPTSAQTASPTPSAAPAPKTAAQARAICSRYLTGSKLQTCVDSLTGKPVSTTVGLPPAEADLVRTRGTPCHIETYEGRNGYHTETFWYCNADGTYEEAYTFTNGHLTSHYVP